MNMLSDNNNSACVANLQAEIHTLQDENTTLYEKIKRMEKNWDSLIKQTSVLESSRCKLEWEISKARGELEAKNKLLQQIGIENAELQVAVNSIRGDNQKLNDQLKQKLEEVHAFQNEAKVATEKYNQTMKVWKEEKRTVTKQKEEIARKLDACEDELQAYFNENAKLEKQLKQMTKDFTNITHAHTQIQEILDSRETNWQKFVRRLGPKHESISDIYKAALSSSFCLVESGGLSPAGVLIANYVEYWNILNGQNVKQMKAVINSLRDFLIEHFLDQDSVLYLLSCTSLILFSLHSTYDKDLDEQVYVRLDDYRLLEEIGIQTNMESYCGSGYSSDSSDYNTEGTAGYTSDSAIESPYATDSNDSTIESKGSRTREPTPKKSASRGKSVVNLRPPAGMLNLVKPLLFKRPPRRDTKTSSKPPLMSDTDASSTDAVSERSAGSVRVELHSMTPRNARAGNATPRSDSGYNTPRESGYASQTNSSDSGYATPRGRQSSGITPHTRARRADYETWEVTIHDSHEFFAELNFMFAMTVAALLKKIYKRLDEILDGSRVEESFAHFCAFRANDQNGQTSTRIVLGELTDVLNALISAFEVHMVYFPLSQKIFEEIFGRIGKMLANIVISRSCARSELFGNFLMVIWERFEALCRGNEWTGTSNRQMSIVKQCAMLLCLKDKSLVDNPKKRETTFPDLNENQIRHIITPEPHRPHSNSTLHSAHHHSAHHSPRELASHHSPRVHHPQHVNATAKLLLFTDLDYVRPFPIRIVHYVGVDELQKLTVPPFLIDTLGVV